LKEDVDFLVRGVEGKTLGNTNARYRHKYRIVTPRKRCYWLRSCIYYSFLERAREKRVSGRPLPAIILLNELDNIIYYTHGRGEEVLRNEKQKTREKERQKRQERERRE
jgi:hypothetical protein